MEKVSTMMKKMNVLEVIEQIVELTSDQGITLETKRGKKQLVTPAKPYIKELMARLGIDDELEALFLAVFVDQSNDCRIAIKDIARHFDVRMVKILALGKHIENLVKKGVIVRKKDSDGDVTYRVPNKTVEALRNGVLPEQLPITNLTAQELYERIDEMLALRDNDEISDQELYQTIDEVFDANPQIEMPSRIRSFGLTPNDQKLFLVFTRIFVNDNDDRICRSDIRDYFSPGALRAHVCRLVEGSHILMKLNLVEHSFDDGQANTEMW